MRPGSPAKCGGASLARAGPASPGHGRALLGSSLAALRLDRACIGTLVLGERTASADE
jgi:hypothetical protein